jgi:hypothetical protein
MKDFIDQYPAMAPFSIKLFERMIRSYKGGKELEAVFTKALQDVAIAAQQKQDQAANQPPDPKILEAQNRMQIAQMQEQGKQQEMSMNMQLEQMKLQNQLQIEQVKAQFNAQAEQARGALDQWIAKQDVQLRTRNLEIEVLKIQVDAGSTQADLALKEKIAAIDSLLQNQAMKLDSHEKKLSLDEHLLEEKRLATDTQIEAGKLNLHQQELGIKAKEVAVKEKIANKPTPKPTHK